MAHKTNSVNKQEKHLAGNYSIEDKKNVINFHKSGRKKPNGKPTRKALALRKWKC